MKLHHWAFCLLTGTTAAAGAMGCGDSSSDSAGSTADASAGSQADGSPGPQADASPGSQADASAMDSMNFFVTSRGAGGGGELGGLDGADAFCGSLAGAVSPALGAKTWHAYLSTSTVNARDRIGTGPWTNAAGVVIASTLEQLHDQLPDDAALNATWPIGTYSIALDEQGMEVPADPLAHDILTGSSTDGTVEADATCNDWTSQETTDIAQVGHSNRDGGGRDPSWNATHTVGCAEPTPGMDFEDGTVSSGGGRGSIYCFAVP